MHHEKALVPHTLSGGIFLKAVRRSSMRRATSDISKTAAEGDVPQRLASSAFVNTPGRGKALLVDAGTFVSGRDNEGPHFDWSAATKHVIRTLGCDPVRLPDPFIAYANPNSPAEVAAAAALSVFGADVRLANPRKNDTDYRLAVDLVETAIDMEGDLDLAILGGDVDFSYAVRQMTKRYPAIFKTGIFCTRKSVSGVWLDSVGWNVEFFPVDDFASPVPPSAPEDDDKTPGLDDLDRIILTSVSSAVERGKHPTLRRTAETVSEYHPYPADRVRERTQALLEEGYLATKQAFTPTTGHHFGTLVTLEKAAHIIGRADRTRRNPWKRG